MRPFPCAVQGRIDAGAHGRKLLSHVEEASELWQNLIGAVHTRVWKLTLMASIPRVA
jgi:hypothetical protein